MRGLKTDHCNDPFSLRSIRNLSGGSDTQNHLILSINRSDPEFARDAKIYWSIGIFCQRKISESSLLPARRMVSGKWKLIPNEGCLRQPKITLSAGWLRD
jgi:hypothetical protein